MINQEARRARARLAAFSRWFRKHSSFFLALLALASLACVDENDVPDWLLKAAQETDALIRKVMPIVRAAQEAVDEARAAQAAAGPSLPPARELALAMDAGMRELLAAIRQQVAIRQRDVLVRVPTLTVGVSLPPVSVFASDTGTATDTLRVRSESPADVGMPLDAKTVFLAIMWIFAILLPLKIGLLSPDVQTIIRDYLVTVGTALIIHWRVTDSRKHDLRWLSGRSFTAWSG